MQRDTPTLSLHVNTRAAQVATDKHTMLFLVVLADDGMAFFLRDLFDIVL